MDKDQLSKLVDKIKQGDQTSFEELYSVSSRSIYFTCISFLRNEEDAKDVMQDVYITVYEKINALNDAEKLIPWMNKIAVNKCKKLLMKRQAVFMDVENAGDEPTEENENFLPEEYITQKEKRKLVMDIMRNTLSDIQYKTVILYYFNGLSIEETASIMECPPGTVKYRLSVARAKIRDGVDAYENRSGDKLYSVVGLPLLMRLLYEEANSMNMPDLLQEMMEAVKSYLTAGAAEVTGAAGGTTESATAAGKTAGKSALMAKIGITAAVVAVIAVGAVFFIRNRGGEEAPDMDMVEDEPEQPSVSEDEPEQPSVSENEPEQEPSVDWYAVEEYDCLPFYLKYADLGSLEENDFSSLMINDTFAYGASLEEILPSYHYIRVDGEECDFTTGQTGYADDHTLGPNEMVELGCYTEEGNYDNDVSIAICNLSDSEATIRECIENDWFVCNANNAMLGTLLDFDKREELAKLVGILGKPTMVTYDSNSWWEVRDEEEETFAETVSKGGGWIYYNIVYIKGDHILSLRISEYITPAGADTWVDLFYLTQDVYDYLLENDSAIHAASHVSYFYNASYIMSDKIYNFE
ncbi:MAG: RNA polymerase sigma factor [Lachnospiraceae bacterium]|nr:RNA polymerase sigma factor [Lachnospiraceae bacterium]